MINRFLKLISLVSVLIITFSCGKNNSIPKHSNSKIVGGGDLGFNNPGRYSAVSIGGWCTGTIVSEDLIVTAAHCLKGKGNRIAIRFVENIFESENSWNTRISYQAHYHEGYDKFSIFSIFSRSMPLDDIGWLKFEGGLPSGFEPIPILSKEGLKYLENGHPVTLVGFGNISENINGDGSKKTVDTVFNKYFYGRKGNGALVTGPTPNRGVCYGDSGGPAYAQVQNNWYLVGATNGPDDLITGARICDQGAGRFAAVGHYLEWLEQTSGVSLLTEIGSKAKGK